MTVHLVIAAALLLAVGVGWFAGYRHATRAEICVWRDRQEEWLRNRAHRAARALRKKAKSTTTEAADIIARELLGR